MPDTAKLIAEGRAVIAAALADGTTQVVLKSEDDNSTTNLLVWAGNNLAALLDALEREPIGYGVIAEGAEGVGGLWVQTSPLLAEADAVDRARFYGHQGARAVAMTEVGE